MRNIFKRKSDTIRFFTTNEFNAEVFPVVPAKSHSFKWYKTFGDQIREAKKADSLSYIPNAGKCPAIIDISARGFYLMLNRDLLIENANGRLKVSSNPRFGEVTEQLKHPASNFFQKMPFVLKISLAWSCVAPKGLLFHYGPVSYPDNTDFYTLPGIYDPSLDCQANIQGIVTTEKPTLLKAGTPLAQIIPLSNKKYKLSCGMATETEAKLPELLLGVASCSRPIDHKLMVATYNKYRDKILHDAR